VISNVLGDNDKFLGPDQIFLALHKKILEIFLVEKPEEPGSRYPENSEERSRTTED
jgi:hypothetical protein